MGWKYKLETFVTDYNPSADFLVFVTVPWRLGIRYDYRDVRFVTKNGTELNYFLESVVNYTSALFCVKVPKNTKFFWTYYGNGAAVSKSDGTKVFTFFDTFKGSVLDGTVWNSWGSGITVSNSILQLLNTSTSCYIESKATYPVNSLIEMRVQKQSGQKGPFGFRSYATERAAAWQGAAGGLLTDHRFSHNGTSGAWHDDDVNRSGAYHIYGVVHIATAPRYNVDYAFRDTNTDIYAGSANLPIQIYCYSNQGYIRADWVRVRTYAATEPTATFGRRFLNKQSEKDYPWDQSITAVSTTLGLSCSVNLKNFLSGIQTSLGLRASVMFRHPQYYVPAARGPFAGWKNEGLIDLGEQSSPARVQMPVYPGMRLNGRDLRFTDQGGNSIEYNIFDVTEDGKLDTWVDNAGIPRIKFFYGNGQATAQSNAAIEGTPETETIWHTLENIAGGGVASHLYSKWTGEGVISLSATSSATGGEQILISLKKVPGMTQDGRDLRFTSPDGRTELNYYIETTTADAFSIWVKLPVLASKIRVFYGNGRATAKSSEENTFDFIDKFPGASLDTGTKWTVVGGTASVSGGLLTLADATHNTMIVTQGTWGAGYIVEMRQYHATNNQMINGWLNTVGQRAAWLGASGASNNDYGHTYNGSNSTTTTDGVNRAGTTFYKYAVARDASECRFYVDDTLRLTISTTNPIGNVSLGAYSEVNSGNVVIDWVRLRRITALTGSLTSYKKRSGGTVYYETTWSEEIEIIPDTLIKHWPKLPAIQVYYDYIAPPAAVLGLRVGDPELIERRELIDYNVGIITVHRSISDAYSQLNTEFQDLIVPPEGSTIKHYGYDSEETPYLLFSGKILPSIIAMGKDQQRVSVTAVDNCVNLVTQAVPWNYQVVDTETVTIPEWIERLIDFEHTGVFLKTAIDSGKDPYQFVFDAKTTRMDAIKKIAEYAGCIFTSKVISREEGESTVTHPEFYFVPPESIDQDYNGFDLPAPVTLVEPATTVLTGSTLVDEPTIEKESEEKYNKVTIYGVLSETGETVVSSAFSYEVYTGDHKAREYTLEDNTISEKGSTAEREAIKWLLYFLAPRAKVKLSFVNRFDLELYQRLKFGSGFPLRFTELTNSEQVANIAVCDPRDAENSTHLVDVSGVPRPSWLRISSLSYRSEHPLETVEVEAVTDFIYSGIDPIIPEPYSDYLSPGYYKPVINDMFATTQSIVTDSIEKQLTPESCTVLSIDLEAKTAVVQTASGKIVTVTLA
jgi:hypothetical protein